MTKLISVVLLLAGVAMAQSCPVKFESVRASETFTNYRDAHFAAKWKNTSGKTIIGMKFQGAFLNTLRESEDVYVPWVSDAKVKPEHSQWGVWNDYFYIRTHDTRYAQLTLLRVAFEDGSYWEDDGSEQCVGYTPGAAKLMTASHVDAKQPQKHTSGTITPIPAFPPSTPIRDVQIPLEEPKN